MISFACIDVKGSMHISVGKNSGTESEGDDEGEKKELDQKFMMHVSLSDVEHPV
jgi:hypothetical protein